MNKIYDEFCNSVDLLGHRNMTRDEVILHAAIGIASEAGEIVEAIKHWRYQGHTFDKEEMSLELGDLLFYIELMTKQLGLTFDVLMERNIKKLKARYPNGFEPEKSLNRNREKEYQAAIDRTKPIAGGY